MNTLEPIQIGQIPLGSILLPGVGHSCSGTFEGWVIYEELGELLVHPEGQSLWWKIRGLISYHYMEFMSFMKKRLDEC